MRCPVRIRHWFTVYGSPGTRSPVCVDCGNPNPRKLTDQEWRQLEALAEIRSVGDRVRTAIEARHASAATAAGQEEAK